MHSNDAEGIANSVDPDQTAPLGANWRGAVWSGSALFAQTYLSENFRIIMVNVSSKVKVSTIPSALVHMSWNMQTQFVRNRVEQ